MRKLLGMLLTVVLVFGSLSGGVLASGQKTLVPDAKATIKIEKTPETEPVDDRKLIVESNAKEIPLLDGVIHVAALPIHIENSKGEMVELLQDDITFTSANEEIFAIEENMLSGKKVGTADLIIGFQGKETRIQIKVMNDVVNLKFEDERAQDFYAFYARYYNSINKEFEYMDISTEYDDKAGVLRIHGIDWSKPAPYYVEFTVDNFAYNIEITQADKNKTKTISNSLTEVSLNTGDKAISYMLPQFIKQGAPASDGTLMEAALHYAVSPGDYVFNVSAVQDTNYYNVSTPTVTVKGAEQAVTVPFDNTVPVKVTSNLQDASTFPSMYVCGAICEDISGDFKTLHVTKDSYLSVMPVIKNEALFYQFDYEWDKISGATELKLDDRIKSTFNLGDHVYKGGSELLLEEVLTIENSAGAQLFAIYDEAFNFYGGQITFENVDDATETYTYNLNHFYFDTIDLPNTTGTFNVAFTFGEIVPDSYPDYVDLQDDWWYYADPIPTVASDYMWTVKFNAPIKEQTVTRQSVFVTDSEGYVLKDVTAYVDGDSIYVYAPEEGYVAGDYYLCVHNSVQNIAGKSNKYSIKMAFTVE